MSMTLILDAHRKRFTSARDILGKSTLKKVYFDRGFYDGEHFDWLGRIKKHIQFVCRGKQRTKVADQVSEIPVEGYVEKILTYPKEYRPKTDRGKGAKAERDALIDEYRNRWGVEVLFKEEKSYGHLNKLPSSILFK